MMSSLCDEEESEDWTVVQEDDKGSHEVVHSSSEEFEQDSVDTCPCSDSVSSGIVGDSQMKISRDTDTEVEKEIETETETENENEIENGNEDENEDENKPFIKMPLHLNLNISQDECARNMLDIPAEYSTLSGEMEAFDAGRGVMAIRVLGAPKAGKSSLASAIADSLTHHGWSLKESNADTEAYRLLSGSKSNSINICSSLEPTPEHFLSLKNLNVCIYALPPHFTPPSTLKDLEDVLAENDYDLVLPVICKADTMTKAELKEYRDELSHLIPKKPNVCLNIFAVVCKPREYSWGRVSPISEVSELNRLCRVLESHLQLDNSSYVEDENCSNHSSLTVNDKTEFAQNSSKLMIALLFTGLLFGFYWLSLVGLPCGIPEIMKSAYSLEVVVFILILSALGEEKELSLVLAICCAIFWRLAEETRQQEVLNMSFSYDELSKQSANSILLLNSCDGELQMCTEKVQNMSLRLYETSERLSLALELCGSWCLEV